MWKLLNSPLVIVVAFLIGLAGVFHISRISIAGEIKDVFAELNDVIETASTDVEKSKAVQKLATELSRQFKQGLRASAGPDKQVQEIKDYAQVKSKLEIGEYKYVDSEWNDRECFIYTIENSSDKYITQINVNYEFFKDSELIDVKNDWLSRIKTLGPGEEFSVKGDRKYKKSVSQSGEQIESRSDSIKITVSSFSFIDID